MEVRWQRRLSPALLALLALGMLGPAALANNAWRGPGGPPATDRPSDPYGPCTADTPEQALAIGVATEPAAAPWYRLDARVDAGGNLAGWNVQFGSLSRRPTGSVTVPPEAFAAGPFGRAILVGSDDGTTSRVDLVAIDDGCSRTVTTSERVIRRATLDPAGRDLYLFMVDRASRADLGVWRRPLDDGVLEQVLGPLPMDPTAEAVFGRTFATDFTWSLDGSRLAVQSCGAEQCRTRLLDVESGAVAMLDEPGQGELLGVTGDTVVIRDACGGLPCAVITIDARTGARRPIAETAGVAVLTRTPAGPRIVFEDAAAGPAALAVADLEGVRTRGVRAAGDRALQAPAASALASAGLPDGWVLLGSEGRITNGTQAGRGTTLLQVEDGSTVELTEVDR